MTAPLIVPMPGNETLARNLCALGAGEFRELDTRAFPDRETYLRFPQAPSGRSVALIATLADPNEKFLPLLFAAYCVPLLACAACAFAVHRLSGGAYAADE